MIKPKLYVKEGCPWCDEAEEFLQEKKIAFERIEVRSNQAAFDEMIELSGQTKTPTMDWEGEVLADFGVDELIPFLKKKGVL
jgi:glutaredoxin 3